MKRLSVLFLLIFFAAPGFAQKAERTDYPEENEYAQGFDSQGSEKDKNPMTKRHEEIDEHFKSSREGLADSFKNARESFESHFHHANESENSSREPREQVLNDQDSNFSAQDEAQSDEEEYARQERERTMSRKKQRSESY